MKKTAIIISLLSALLLAACSSGDAGGEENDGEQKTIYTTVYPLQFIIEEIAGDSLQVESILPAGTDAHTYEPTTREMVDMAEGEAFVYTKNEFEAYAETIADTLKEEGVNTIPAAEGMEGLTDEGEEHTEEAEHEESGHEGHNHSVNGEDPHIWLDPMLMTTIAERVKEELAEMYPSEEKKFEENEEALKNRLTELDEKMASTIKEADTKEVIVSHAAYGYWEEAYGLKQIPISGLSSTNEPSQKELEQVIETADEHGLNYILFEKNVSPKAAKVVQDEIGAEALYLHNLATRTEEEINEGEDYFDLMEKNREALQQALNN